MFNTGPNGIKFESLKQNLEFKSYRNTNNMVIQRRRRN